ncbi:MAG: hypothetical protein ACOYIF_05705 [Acetivibrionales bacterium]|jgi:hypothetical protein
MSNYVKKIMIFMLLVVFLCGCNGRSQNIDNKKMNPAATETTEKPDSDINTSTSQPSLSSTPEPVVSKTPYVLATPTEDSELNSDTKDLRTYTLEEIDKMIEDRNDITDPLVEQYIYWMHELDREYTPKNLIMAAKYRNIGGVYFFRKEAVAENGYTDWEKETPNAVQYMKRQPYIPIVSEITADFILITAIVQPIGDDEYKEFYDLMNETRNLQNEVEFLKGLNELGYYAVDIYVDDLLLSDREIPCNGIKMYEEYAIDLEERFDNLTEMPNDDALIDYLKKYNRNINFSKQLKNKEWNLFLFNKRNNQPANISLYIRTHNTKGGLGLRQKYYFSD